MAERLPSLQSCSIQPNLMYIVLSLHIRMWFLSQVVVTEYHSTTGFTRDAGDMDSCFLCPGFHQ